MDMKFIAVFCVYLFLQVTTAYPKLDIGQNLNENDHKFDEEAYYTRLDDVVTTESVVNEGDTTESVINEGDVTESVPIEDDTTESVVNDDVTTENILNEDVTENFNGDVTENNPIENDDIIVTEQIQNEDGNENIHEEVPNENSPDVNIPNEDIPSEDIPNENVPNENVLNENVPNEPVFNENQNENRNESNQNLGRSSASHADLTEDTDDFKTLYQPAEQTEVFQTPQVRIVGGLLVLKREDFAFQASFRTKSGQHFCGASIIDDKNLLTAAHCVYDDSQRLLSASRLIIVVGDLNVLQPNEYTIVRTVEHIFPHPDYNYHTFQNDVAILRVESLGNFTDFVHKIDLANETPSPGTKCIVSGWGKTSSNGLSSPELRQVTVPIVSKQECMSGYPNGILNGMLCAGLMEGGKDACQGDSGGPLVCDNKLAGIVSWGRDCALKNHPGVYTDVAAYYNWIRIQQGFGSEEPPIEPRKVGLIVEKREEFPYQASLRYSAPNTHFCGATIIDKNHLLTSAHCVTNDTQVVNSSNLEVVVGDLNILEEAESTTYRTVSHIFVHENYNPNTFENDIAVIRLSEPFEQWTKEINAIELDVESPEAYTICTVSGWGSATSPTSPNEALRFNNIPIIENGTCQSKYPDAIKPGMFCAGFVEKGKDSCQGDGGGPLVCNNKLSGIVSWGHRCANDGLPGVYTDVTQYRNWVDEQKARSSSNSLYKTPFVFVICFSLLKIINF